MPRLPWRGPGKRSRRSAAQQSRCATHVTGELPGNHGLIYALAEPLTSHTHVSPLMQLQALTNMLTGMVEV